MRIATLQSALGPARIAAVVCCLLVQGCATTRPDTGDAWASRLKPGMSKEEVRRQLGSPRLTDHLRFPGSYSLFNGDEVVPYDLLRFLPEGSETWTYPYWRTSNTQFELTLFFSAVDLLLGWSKPHSDASRERYKHEKITSELRRGMSQSRVVEQWGRPQKIITTARKESRELYVDLHWSGDPLGIVYWPMWVYTYPVSNGKTRNVYIVFDNKSDVVAWGYDNAYEEAQRYLRERVNK